MYRVRRGDDRSWSPRTPLFKGQGEKRNPCRKQTANMEENPGKADTEWEAGKYFKKKGIFNSYKWQHIQIKERKAITGYGKLQQNGEDRNQITMD